MLADGRKRSRPILIVGADGSNSRLRDSLGLLCEAQVSGRWPHAPADRQDRGGASQRRRQDHRILVGHAAHALHAVQRDDIYIALTMLDTDETAQGGAGATRTRWKRWFPAPRGADRAHRRRRALRSLRADQARPLVGGARAVIGDAAHAMPPNIGQGGGCAMMNALSLAVHLERHADIAAALAAWEQQRAAGHRTHAADFLSARPADHLAAAAAGNRARLGGAFEMARPPAHEDGIAPADGDNAIATLLAHIALRVASRPAARCAYHRQPRQDDGRRQ